MCKNRGFVGNMCAGSFLLIGFIPFFIYSQDRVTVDDIYALAEKNLSTGDRSRVVKQFYALFGPYFDYDHAGLSEFSGVLYRISPFTVIPKQIWMIAEVDSKRRFLRLEAEVDYTPLWP